MTSPRTLLGPLTTTWTAPGVCSYVMALGCQTCSSGWIWQTCNPSSDAHDWTNCWPPRTSGVADPGVMMGWGFYSPGLVCPQGYTTAAMATSGGSTGWGLEYSLTDGETAAACCPTGFTPSTVETLNTYAATCVAIQTSASFSTVVCDSGQYTGFNGITIPNSAMSDFTVLAPLIQLNFRAQDVPATTTSQTSSSTSTAQEASPHTVTTVATTTVNGQTSLATITSVSSSSISSSASGVGAGSGVSSSTSPAPNSGGLSTAAKAGIGVGAGVGGLLVLALIFFLLRRKRRRHTISSLGTETEKEDGSDPSRNPSKHTELCGELSGGQLSELEANAPTELPATSTSIGHPRQPAALFELEGSAHRVRGDVSPVTPHYERRPVTPLTPTRLRESVGVDDD